MVDSNCLDIIFRNARTYSTWTDKSVTPDLLKKVYDLAKMGATSANCSPMRVVFVQSVAAKEKLKPCLAEGNVEKTMTAPVTALIAADDEFYNKLPILFPHVDAKSWFVGNEELIKTTAFRNSTLQGAYLMLAARACGLDCGPMSGFNNQLLDDTFFKGTTYKSNFICNLGYGDPKGLFPRSPRLDFDDACKII